MELGRSLGYSLRYSNIGDIISDPIFLVICGSVPSSSRYLVHGEMRGQILRTVGGVYNIIVEDSLW